MGNKDYSKEPNKKARIDMRYFTLLIVAALCCSTSYGVISAGTTACSPANPFGTTRCSAAKKYNDGTNDLAGCTCTTVVGTYQKQAGTTFDTTGASNDLLCSATCKVDTASTDKQCDSTGLLCAACADTYATNGKTPSAASPQLCACATANSVTSCSSCAHNYYGTDGSGVAVTPTDTTQGTTDATAYLVYTGATTLPTKCVACPTTLTNCAQCASATVCARCTTGNTLDTNGSCSASKIIASIAFAFVGLVALLF